MGAIEDRLGDLGLSLPAPVAPPPGVRLPFELVRVHGDVAYVSGHGPFDGDTQLFSGRVGTDITVEQGYEYAGRHTRSAIGSGELPFGMPVEVEAVVAL